MTISIDANVIVALWKKDNESNAAASAMLNAAQQQGSLVICGPVYAELVANLQQNPQSLSAFLDDCRIAVEWRFDEEDWREAGRAYGGYAQRRRKNGDGLPRRILADFMVGADALMRGHSLLTTDSGRYAAAFPKLKLIRN